MLLLGLLTRREAGRQTHIFNLSSTLTVGLTVVMLVSAFKRLLLYEMAYGFTEMRIYPHVFMIWLALLLGWFLVTLWVRPGRFAIGSGRRMHRVRGDAGRDERGRLHRPAQCAAVRATWIGRFLRGRDVYDPDNPGIDPAYLTSLSADAIPALVQSVDRLAGAPKREVSDYLLRPCWLMREDPAQRQVARVPPGRRGGRTLPWPRWTAEDRRSRAMIDDVVKIYPCSYMMSVIFLRHTRVLSMIE